MQSAIQRSAPPVPLAAAAAALAAGWPAPALLDALRSGRGLAPALVLLAISIALAAGLWVGWRPAHWTTVGLVLIGTAAAIVALVDPWPLGDTFRERLTLPVGVVLLVLLLVPPSSRQWFRPSV